MDRPTSAQIRGARAMLGWSMLNLAAAARVSVATVSLVENGHPAPAAAGAADLMRDALESEGVRFLDDDGHGRGVRLRERRRAADAPRRGLDGP